MGQDGWQQWAYVAACLVVPAIWGVVSAWIFGRIDARRRAKKLALPDRPPVDYSI